MIETAELDARITQIDQEIGKLQAERAALAAQRNAQAASFYHVPDEVLAMIMRCFYASYTLHTEDGDRLELREDLKALAYSCKRLREMATTPELVTYTDVLWDQHWLALAEKRAQVSNVEVQIRASDSAYQMKNFHCRWASSLFVIFDVNFLANDEETDEWQPLNIDCIDTLRILFTKKRQSAHTFVEFWGEESEIWDRLTSLTLEGAHLDSVPVTFLGLKRLDLNSMSLDLSSIVTLLYSSCHLESISFRDLVVVRSRERGEYEQQDLHNLADLYISGGAYTVSSVLALLLGDSVATEDWTTMSPTESREHAISHMLRLWRTPRDTVAGFATGVVKYHRYTEGRIIFVDNSLPAMSWMVDPSVVQDSQLLQSVHTLELDCYFPAHMFGYHFLAGLPMRHLPNLKRLRICYLGCPGESRVSERISPSACAQALAKKLVAIGGVDSVTWNE